MRMHFFTFCMRIHAHFGFRSNTLGIGFIVGVNRILQQEDHWSCITHLSAKDMLKSAVIEEKKFKNNESE